MVLFKKVKTNGGFTLLEILIALVIFVLGSVSIWSLFAVAVNTYNESLDHQVATLVAESIIAEFEDVDVVKGKVLLPVYEGKSIHFPDYKYQLKWVDLGNDALLIKLKIFYQRRGQERDFEFRTVMYRSVQEQP